MKLARTIAVLVLLWHIFVGLCGPPLAQAQLAVADLTPLESARVRVTYSNAVTNRQTNQTTMTATIKNISSTAVTGPVYLAIEAITPPTVTIVNAPITSVEGMPLFVVEATSWPAGTSRAIKLVFANPTRVRMNVQHRILVKAANGTTPPQVAITAPAPFSLGNQTAITVTGTASADAIDVAVNGVPAILQNQTWTATVPLQEGSNILTATARNAAGQVGTASIQVTRDTVAPTLAATVTPLPNAAGWHQTDVTVTFTATDSLAGIATVTAPVSLTTDSAAHVVSGVATDRAGNSSSLDVPVRLDKTPPGVTITSPAHGTTLTTAGVTVTGTVSDALSGVASVTCNGTVATVSNATFTCNVSLTEGANTVQVQATDSAGNVATASLMVTLDTTPPQVTIETPAPNAVLFAPQVRVAGAVDDQTAHVSVNGQGATVSNGRWEVTLPLELGATTITVMATDGVGNTGQQSVQVTRQDVVVESITVTPVASRLAAEGAQQPLTVMGRLTDGTTQNLTAGSTGTTYASSQPFVATGSADGVVTAVGNGSTTITVGYQTFSATAAITVEAGVNLTTLDLSPTRTTLRAGGATQQHSLTGSFSDGSTRDLRAASTGTTYTSSAPTIATVSADGLVTAVANGEATLTAANEQRHASAQITVTISSGAGFVRGEVYDDSTGLPLAQAMVTLLGDGGGPVDPSITMTADEQGQFLLVGLAGEFLVHITKEGFTSVERRGVIPQDTAFTLLDARLTPRASQGQAIPSALGGEASSQSGEARLVFPPGSVPADVNVWLTVLSNQGLQERLPLGWSPIAAVDVFPSGLALGQPALLQVPNTLSLPPGREVLTAAYDLLGHQWLGQVSAVVTPDGQHIETEIRSTGQWVLLLPDEAPFTPPTVQTGQALQGIAPVTLPATLSASSVVVPPSAPAGDNARATGTIILATTSPLPSGTRVQAHVSERFNLLDASSVIPLPFTQDLLTYAQPRQGETAGLSTQFPITPSRNFTIRELALGVVRITVTAPEVDIHGTVVGASGGTVTDAAGNTIDLPANGLPANRAIDLLPRTAEQLAVAIPDGFAMLAAVQLDLVGTSLAQPATLSMPRPADLPDTAQVILAQVIGDPAGFRRLRLVAVGRIQGTRVVSQTQVNGLILPGITTGGQYVFLRPPAPLGFITGVVSVPGGAPQALAVVTADTAPLADVTAGNGAYIIVGQAGGETQVTATHVRGDVGTGTVNVSAAEAVVILDLMLHVVGPTVVSTTPANGAVNVPLNTSVRVQFSEVLDPETVTVGSLELQQNGTPVPGPLTLSADGRTVTLRPDTELGSNTIYTLLLTDDLHDLAGNPLDAMVLHFTTLDTSKPPQPSAGQITAALPDDDHLVLIFGTQGTAEANSAVTATNLRTQETITVLALPDGSFRLRMAATLGDDLALTFRNSAGKDVTTAITQLANLDGTTALWDKGGTVTGPQGRVASILPRALATPAILAVQALANPSALPVLPPELSYVDSFGLTMTGGTLNRLRSLQLSETQNRFDPAVATIAPFAATGSLVVPTNFLVNGQVTFAAVAEDVNGNRQRVEGSTLVVEVNPATDRLATAFTDYFPTVFLDVPQEATPNQQLQVDTVARTPGCLHPARASCKAWRVCSRPSPWASRHISSAMRALICAWVRTL